MDVELSFLDIVVDYVGRGVLRAKVENGSSRQNVRIRDSC